MSSLGGSSSWGKRLRIASTVSSVSSTDSVVCESQATLSGSRTSIASTSSGPSTSWMCRAPRPRCPRPPRGPRGRSAGCRSRRSANRFASWCTLVTSGQVASIVFRPRACGLLRARPARRRGRRRRPWRPRAPRRSPRRRSRRALEVGDHVLVVHDLLAHVDGRAVEVERLLHRDHRPVDAGAVAARARPGARRARPPSGGRTARRTQVSGHDAQSVGRAQPLGCRHGPRRPRPEQPAPVRQIAQAIGGWIDRLGAVWVEGQVAQISRRPGMATVFLTLRDPVADISVARSPAPPASSTRCPLRWSRARSVVVPRQADVLRQPRHALRSSAARSAWSASASCWPGSSGAGSCWPPRACSPPSASGRCRSSPRRVGLVTAPELAPPSATCSRTPAGAGRRCGSRSGTPRCRAERRRARSSRRSQRLDRDPDVDVIVIARGGGSVEDLLPFSDEALIRAVSRCARRWSARSATSPTARCSTWSPTCAPRRRPTPPSGSCRTSPRRRQRVPQMRERGRLAVRAMLEPRAAAASPRSASPTRAWPTRATWLVERSREVDAPARPGPSYRRATGSTGLATTSATSWPGCAHCPRSRRSPRLRGAADRRRRRASPTVGHRSRPATCSTSAWPTAGSAPP